ncbi:hypothetical protein D3C73_1636670 [compost metagenome]
MLRVKLFDKVEIPIDGVCCSTIPVASILTFMWGQYIYTTIFAIQIPIAADSNVGMQHKRFILG